MNDRWVCKRCFADNEGAAPQCHKCGLLRGAESTAADQSAWAATPAAADAGGQGRGSGLLPILLRFWWIPAAAIVLVVGYLTTAQRDDDGTVSDAGTLTVEDLRVGDCFNEATFTSSGDVEVNDVDAVPCTESHAYEVYAVTDYDGAVFPGPDAIFETAFMQVCVPPFEDYVGIAWEDSLLWASAIIPSEEGWNAGDREFICHLHEGDSSPLTESQRGAAR
jgi:hypothetical protein